MEEIIKAYFQAWLNQQIEILPELFDEHVIYSECYGPEYHGLEQVMRWFSDWHMHGRVLEWRIKNMIVHEKTTVAEWYFKCCYDQKISHFDGVTIAVFNEKQKIITLKEFQSQDEHYFPYDFQE